MMRKILFRGKRKDNYEWHEGFYARHGKTHYIIEMVNELIANWYEVFPETVGQYTGLTDKNGKRIFEGDILRVTTFNGFIDRCVVGYGTFEAFGASSKNVGFYLCWSSDKERRQKYANIAWWLETRGAVCVGNIHDNPELLEGGCR